MMTHSSRSGCQRCSHTVHPQKNTWSPSCTTRLGSDVLVILPKFALPGSEIGSANCARLNRLKKSARNWKRRTSLPGILTSFCSEKSKLFTPGFRRSAKYRCASPNALFGSPAPVGVSSPGAGHVPEKSNAFRLNHDAVVCSKPLGSGSPTSCGRLVNVCDGLQ